MKIAVTYENGNVFQHFGHTEQFKIYRIEDGKIADSEIVSAVGSGHGALAGFLKGRQVDALICGGIGGGARQALAESNIDLYPGVTGSADESIAAFLVNALPYDPDATCSHHHGEEHSCGGHSCGEDKHGCAGNH